MTIFKTTHFKSIIEDVAESILELNDAVDWAVRHSDTLAQHMTDKAYILPKKGEFEEEIRQIRAKKQ